MLYTERLKLDSRSDHSKVESSAISKSILSNPLVKEYIQFLHYWNVVYSMTLPTLNPSVFQKFLWENTQRLKKDLEAIKGNKNYSI